MRITEHDCNWVIGHPQAKLKRKLHTVFKFECESQSEINLIIEFINSDPISEVNEANEATS